jgi:hypothetical protein
MSDRVIRNYSVRPIGITHIRINDRPLCSLPSVTGRSHTAGGAYHFFLAARLCVQYFVIRSDTAFLAALDILARSRGRCEIAASLFSAAHLFLCASAILRRRSAEILLRFLLSLAGPRLRLRFSTAPATSGNAALIVARTVLGRFLVERVAITSRAPLLNNTHRHGRDDAGSRELLHGQVHEVGLHRLQRRL